MSLSLHNLEIGYSQPLQPPLELEVTPASVIGVVGPNGAGKTSLIYTILGILKPISGNVHLAGRLGVQFQDRALPLNVAASRWIEHMANLWKVPVNEALLASLECEPTSKPIRRLSGGAQQKLALYGALHHKPDVVILDEPTNNLDAPTRQNFYEVVRTMQNQGTTFLIASHQASDLAALNATIVNFGTTNAYARQALVVFSAAIDLATCPANIFIAQTSAGILLGSYDTSADLMLIATTLAQQSHATIVSFQVVS